MFEYVLDLNQSQKSIHFPDIKDIDYEYHTFKFSKLFDDEYMIEQIIIKLVDFNGLTTDFRFKDQSNHKIYVKFYDTSKKINITPWLNACEVCGPLGIIDKDDTPCLKLKGSTTYKRTCFIKQRVKPSVNIYIRIGVPIELKNIIHVGNVEIGF